MYYQEEKIIIINKINIENFFKYIGLNVCVNYNLKKEILFGKTRYFFSIPYFEIYYEFDFGYIEYIKITLVNKDGNLLRERIIDYYNDGGFIFDMGTIRHLSGHLNIELCKCKFDFKKFTKSIEIDYEHDNDVSVREKFNEIFRKKEVTFMSEMRLWGDELYRKWYIYVELMS